MPRSLPLASTKPSTTLAGRPVTDLLLALGCVWDLDLTDVQRWFLMRAAEIYPRSSHRLSWGDLTDSEHLAIARVLTPWCELARLLARELA